MKILFLMSSLRVGGAERVASTLLNHWANNGQQIILVTLDSVDSDSYVMDQRIVRHALNSYASSRNIIEKIFAVSKRILRIRKLVTQHRPDVVVSFMTSNNILATIACLFTKVPVVITERTYPPYFNHNNLFDIFRKIIYKYSTAFVAQTSNVAKWAQGFLSSKIVVIANPLDPKALMPQLDQPRANNIIAVGRLCPEKGFDLLINAYQQIQAQYPAWQLLIIGEGPERAKLEAQIKDLGLEAKIKLIGEVKNPQTYYAQAKIFALSSRVEGFPNVLLEAMAHELAVVSFDCNSGPADIIQDQINGLLVPYADVELLAVALQKLMQDSVLRDSLSKEAIKIRSAYTLESISEQWLGLFKEVMC